MAVDNWFLHSQERGNPATAIDRRHSPETAWTTGNNVTALVHGRSYFDRLAAELEQCGKSDTVMLTDWRGDPDEVLCDGGPSVAEALSAAAGRGTAVYGLIWRSHLDAFRFSAAENRSLVSAVDSSGGDLLLDQRVRVGGSHHQKLCVIRSPSGGEQPAGEVAFVGGIDLGHSRRDDERHLGDPQAMTLAAEYGERPPWHDVQLEVHGPAVGDLDWTFRERWCDPHLLDHLPWSALADRMREDVDTHAHALTPRPPDPAPCGSHAVQVLRTYPCQQPSYPFAPRGEFSIARAVGKALRRAHRLIYVEDQFLWSRQVAAVFAAALRRSPELHIIVVVPRFPDRDDGIARPAYAYGRQCAIETMTEAGPGRVHVFDIENEQGTPVYVHAKVLVVDDVWALVGSANLNLRSWSHDSELSCAVLDEDRDQRAPADPAGLGDGARRFARDLRLRLLGEHLGGAVPEETLLDPMDTVDTVRRVAAELDAWYAAGCRGPRPAGRLRSHQFLPLGRVGRLAGRTIYRYLYDPDGRPASARWRNRW